MSISSEYRIARPLFNDSSVVSGSRMTAYIDNYYYYYYQ